MTNDDEYLEGYLRLFRPAEPAPLPLSHSPLRRMRLRRPFAYAAMAATILIAAGTWLLVARKSAPAAPKTSVVADEGAASQPLTIRRANKLLFESRSVEDALNRMAFSRKPKTPAGRWSALGVLGRENSRL